jgi:hypothetical protein
MSEFELYVEKTFLSEQELVDSHSKTRGLNSIKLRVDDLYSKTEDKRVLAKLASIYLLLEDAYKISMYKFQFKTFVYAMTKELKNLEEFVARMNEV